MKNIIHLKINMRGYCRNWININYRKDFDMIILVMGNFPTNSYPKELKSLIQKHWNCSLNIEKLSKKDLSLS